MRDPAVVALVKVNIGKTSRSEFLPGGTHCRPWFYRVNKPSPPSSTFVSLYSLSRELDPSIKKRTEEGGYKNVDNCI